MKINTLNEHTRNTQTQIADEVTISQSANWHIFRQHQKTGIIDKDSKILDPREKCN